MRSPALAIVPWSSFSVLGVAPALAHEDGHQRDWPAERLELSTDVESIINRLGRFNSNSQGATGSRRRMPSMVMGSVTPSKEPLPEEPKQRVTIEPLRPIDRDLLRLDVGIERHIVRAPYPA